MDVHKPKFQESVDYLRHLGFSTDEINVYVHLLRHGPKTVLDLSRGLKSGRTKLYSVLDELAAKGLVNIHERHYGTSYEACGPETIDHLVNQHELQAISLRKGLPAALHHLKEIQQLSPSTSIIKEYEGIDGLKQMSWNLSKSRTDIKRLVHPATGKALGKHFNDKLQSLLDTTKSTRYTLANCKLTPKMTTIASSFCQYRYLEPNKYTIDHETYIYNNVVTLINYQNSSISGQEIYSETLSREFNKLFDLLWLQST